MDDLEPDDGLVDRPLVSPFLDSDDNSDDGEVLNELEEYGNAGKLCQKGSTGRNLVAIVKDVYVFVGSFNYITDFVVLEDIGEFIVSDMTDVVMGKPFRKFTKLEPIGDIEDKVDNPSPQSTSQVLLSFEVYTPPVTYPKEVDETMGISMEVEPLDHTKIEDLGLNTYSHDLSLCSREILSINEPKPQLLPNFSPLDVNLGDKRGTDPPINPYSPDSLGR
ncbi:hypothetical protein Tco_0336129 [Tanacetum coccineum]